MTKKSILFTAVVLSAFLVLHVTGCTKKNPVAPAATATLAPTATAVIVPTIADPNATLTAIAGLWTATESPTFTVTCTITISATESQTSTISPTATQTSTRVCGMALGSDLNDETNTWSSGYTVANKYTAAANYTINEAAIKLALATSFEIGIYTNSASKPGALLAQTGAHAGVVGWNSAPISLAITSGTVYWIVIRFKEDVSVSLSYFPSGTGMSMYVVRDWTDGLPAAAGTLSWVDDGADYVNKAAIYGCKN
jgi:hypothetical protein